MGDYQVMPPLSADQREELKASIAANGVLEPVEFDEHGDILDGHTRVELWQELRRDGVKVPAYPKRTVNGMSEAEKRAHVLTVNLARRHLKPEQRAELVAGLREQGWSIRRIAKATGASVGTVHADTAGVQDRTPDTVKGQDGKQHPSRRRRKPRGSVAGHEPGQDIQRALKRLTELLDGEGDWLAKADGETFRLALDVWHKLPHDAAFAAELRKVLGIRRRSRV